MNQICSICNKHREQKDMVYQNEFLYVSHYLPHPDREDNYLGYYFIESKRHFKGIYDATKEEAIALGLMQRRLALAIKSIPEIDHVYSFVIGEGVDHFHIHMIGKYRNTPREYCGPRIDDWPEAPRGDRQDVLELNRRVKDYLQRQIPLLEAE